MRISRFRKSCKRLKELSKYSLNQFKSNQDFIDILWENNIINRLKHDMLIDLIKVRNILVHNYVYLPPEKLYETIRSLDILIEIMSIFLKYMEENGIDP